jgi:anthranilate synthase/aminodeoxychorismate synthase-like glutamine amidotransferase
VLRTVADRRVLLIDFEDSFVHNLADYFRRLGATTRVVSAHDPADAAWTGPAATHLVLSPGPGRPEDFPEWRRHLAKAEAHGIPVLGVCLGHQALAEAAGARVVRHTETVHGRASPLHRTRAGIDDPVLGRWRGVLVGRYHSLVAAEGTHDMVPLAALDDGTTMAVRYTDRPWWGLQFHPESLLTEDGSAILAAFLEVAGRG